MLERKRAALRRALKTEYINKSYNPKNYTAEGYIEMHDASLMRYHAMHKTSSEFWYPNIRSFFMFLGITILPIATHYYLSSRDRMDFERKCRSGEYAYDDPARATRWWSTLI